MVGNLVVLGIGTVMIYLCCDLSKRFRVLFRGVLEGLEFINEVVDGWLLIVVYL